MNAINEVNGPLTGCRIVLTRPSHQAPPLKAEIERLGGEVVLFPTLVIVATNDQKTTDALTGHPGADLVVFVSPNAVWHGVRLARSRVSWLENAAIAAVGRATADALAGLGLSVNWVPEQASGAQALLELPALQSPNIRGCRVVVFKGRGGLATLTDGLASRGAAVEELEVYERRRPEFDVTWFVARGERGEFDLIVITSGDSLRNLFDMVGETGRWWLSQIELLVVSDRIADMALEWGVLRRPNVARGAANEQILGALMRWKETKHDGQERSHRRTGRR